MVYLNAHYSMLWVKKVIVDFLQQLDLKNKTGTLIPFGINGLIYLLLLTQYGQGKKLIINILIGYKIL